MRRILSFLLLASLPHSPLGAADLSGNLKALQSVGPKGTGHRQATLAWQEVARTDAMQLPAVLASLDDAGPIAANWIRAAVDAIAERQVQRGGKLPLAELEKFVLDTDHTPQARRLAFEWLTRGDATAPDRLIPGMLHDPSTEFRRDAVERLLAEAEPLEKSGQTEPAAALYRKAFDGARDLDQIELLAKKLRELKQPFDLPRHFGFLMQWKLIGPFDNTNKQGYAIAYPPEKELSFAASYAGKAGTVAWIDHTTEDEHGLVDLNQALGKHMGAVGYAVAHFASDREQAVDVRLGCINANKVWLNGKLLMQREVYHANTKIDQYVAQARLRPGTNVILVKCCQNEQTDSWAQNWRFQLRICDPTGTAILSADRPK
jgi:hypothetical protein